MTKTRDDIIRRALLMLGVLGAGQPVPAEDAEKIDLDAVAEQLAGERVIDLVQWVKAGELPLAVYMPFAGVVAAHHATSFNLPADALAALEAQSRRTLERIENKTRPLREAVMPRIVGR
jgi:hypothetical protein